MRGLCSKQRVQCVSPRDRTIPNQSQQREVRDFAIHADSAFGVRTNKTRTSFSSSSGAKVSTPSLTANDISSESLPLSRLTPIAIQPILDPGPFPTTRWPSAIFPVLLFRSPSSCGLEKRKDSRPRNPSKGRTAHDDRPTLVPPERRHQTPRHARLLVFSNARWAPLGLWEVPSGWTSPAGRPWTGGRERLPMARARGRFSVWILSSVWTLCIPP